LLVVKQRCNYAKNTPIQITRSDIKKGVKGDVKTVAKLNLTVPDTLWLKPDKCTYDKHIRTAAFSS
jgi:hypothetical protein